MNAQAETFPPIVQQCKPDPYSAWWVLGVGYGINEWSQCEGFEGRKALHKDMVRGILVAALGVLARHYGYER